MGFCGFDFLLKLPIDKLLAVWYNGNSARLGRGRAAKTKRPKGVPLGITFSSALVGTTASRQVAGPLASTALALGWGSIGSTPLKEP